jgi:hypothetical protein
VERVLGTGLPTPAEQGGDAIAAAIEAWVVTPLHVNERRAAQRTFALSRRF